MKMVFKSAFFAVLATTALFNSICAKNGELSRVSYAEKLITFKNLANSQKSDWLDLMKSHYDEKFDLLKKHYADWTKFGTKTIKTWEALKDEVTPEVKNKLFASQLRTAVELHKSQMGEWKNFSDKHFEQVNKLRTKHEDAINEFSTGLEKSKKRDE